MIFNAKKITAFLAMILSSALVFAVEAKVVSVSGKCEYEDKGSWKSLEAGQLLAAGTKIQTGFKSELVLSLESSNENSKITVAQLSRMTIEQLTTSEKMDKTNVFVDTGSIKSEINRTGTKKVNFTVRSPVATASVRGTILLFKTVVGGSRVYTQRGKVAVWDNFVADSENLEDTENEVVFPSEASDVQVYQEIEISNNRKNKDALEIASGKAREQNSVKTASENEVNSFADQQTAAVAGKAETGKIKLQIEWE